MKHIAFNSAAASVTQFTICMAVGRSIWDQIPTMPWESVLTDFVNAPLIDPVLGRRCAPALGSRTCMMRTAYHVYELGVRRHACRRKLRQPQMTCQ